MTRTTGILLAIAMATLIVLVSLWEFDELASPGPLHRAHRDLAELQGAAGCSGCHGDAARGLSDACADCHQPIAAQLARRIGLHGQLDAHACGACHIEHGGDSVSLVGAHAFARAGVEDRDRYDHVHVANYRLAGKHDELGCEACHAHAEAELLPAGEPRFLGLSQTCVTCHRDAHDGALGSDCAACHGQQQPFPVAPEFEHDPRFALTGAHADVACHACHEPDALRTTPAQAPVRACVTCHDNPHAEPIASTVAGRIRLRDTGDCAACHDTTAFAEAAFGHEDHARVSFALEGPHADVTCVACHGRGSEPARWSGTSRVGAEACARCHDSPHRPELIEAVACVDCHGFTDQSFRVPAARISHAHHAIAGFQLTPPHGEVACSSCHTDIGEPITFALKFPGRSGDDCAACHEEPHAGQFGTSRRCTECHARTHFSPTTFGVAAHSKTAFPLTGAHDAVACSGCHEIADLGHGARARRFAGTATTCAACHSDPHSGAFQRSSGVRGCAACHRTSSFANVAWDADQHRQWTGYALRGAHRDAACTACHGKPFAAAPTDCAACHEDVHIGQFATRGRTDCSRCHDDESRTFSHLVFDHDRDSRFALDATHRDLECSACHRESATRSGAAVVRYKPLGVECIDCHRADPRRRR